MDSRWLLSDPEPLALTSPLDRTAAQTHAGTRPLKFLFLWALDLPTEMLPASSAPRYLEEIHLGQGFLPAALFICLLTILLCLFAYATRVFCLHLYWDVCFLFLTDCFRGTLYSLGMSHLLDICIANVLQMGSCLFTLGLPPGVLSFSVVDFVKLPVYASGLCVLVQECCLTQAHGASPPSSLKALLSSPSPLGRVLL